MGQTLQESLLNPTNRPQVVVDCAKLVEEGHAIPIARVQAMHEGKRRARARRS